MLRIKPVDRDNVDNKTAETLVSVETKLGMLPNLFTTLAQSSSALDGYLQFADAVSRGHLSSQQREMLAIAVAQENSCRYCLSAHTAIGKGLGLDDSAIASARRGKGIDPVDDAIIKFALQVVRLAGNVNNKDIENLRKAGGNDGLVIEIVANVALNILTNYVNLVAGTEVDFPPVTLDSVA